MAKKKMDFEQAMERIEQIIDEIENGELPLKMSISLYKEAMELSAICSGFLNKAEKEVLVLQKNGELSKMPD